MSYVTQPYAECPVCRQLTLMQIAIADICQNENCNYSQGY